jgi:RNA polymerase sigma-70 factor, ECF subfamily
MKDVRTHQNEAPALFSALRKLSAARTAMIEEPITPDSDKNLDSEKIAEEKAVHLAQRGDASGFEQLYSKYSRYVYALCLRMTKNAAEAEDLTQNAFLQAFRKIHTFRGESRFSTWLHRLTVNIVLIHFRKKRHPQVSLDEMMEPKGESSPTLPELAAPDLNLNGTVDRLSLRWAIRQLPQGSRKMLLLTLRGYGPSEVARLVGCSVGNSKSQLHKARRRLRELLPGYHAGRTHRQPGEEVEGRPMDGSSLSASALKETPAT